MAQTQQQIAENRRRYEELRAAGQELTPKGLPEPTALDGAPGIYSARWAGERKNFALAMARVERELRARTTKDFSAKFVCVLALAKPDGETQIFEGEVLGRLSFPPRGTKGFGYDPIFIADGMRETFAELEPAHKHAISHRARAFAKLAAYLQ